MDERLYGTKKSFSYLSLETKSTYTGRAFTNSENATHDGINYSVSRRKMLYATYYFMQNERIEHRR